MEWLHSIIGSDADTIQWWQMCIRAVLVFFYGLLLIRYGGKRLFGKNTSFDIVVGVVLGSVLSRALTANAQFIPAMAAATVLVILDRLIAAAAFRSHRFGRFVKGTEDQVVENGRILWRQMKKNSITENDLKEAVRIRGRTDSFSDVKAAYLERNGDFSVIRK